MTTIEQAAAAPTLTMTPGAAAEPGPDLGLESHTRPPGAATTLIRDVAQLAIEDEEAVAEMFRALVADPGATFDPLGIGSTLLDVLEKYCADPFHAWQIALDLWKEMLALGQNTAARVVDATVPPLVVPAANDRRFRDLAWDANPFFAALKQSYLVAARSLCAAVDQIEYGDSHAARKARFWTRQFVDALAPTNFLATNPEALRATLDSGGINLVRGMQHLLDDLKAHPGMLMPRMTDLDAFAVGRNVAVTPGKVVYQNDLMQLIQYAPTTDTVYQHPLLVVPPWINKYYILDLRPDNSMIRWLVGQGYTVFVISWVNPDTRQATKTFDDYVTEGPLAALDAIERATGEGEVTVAGYCVGGTLTAATLASMAASGDDRVRACTLFATQVDFANPGDLQVFIDDEQLASLEQRMQQRGGILDADAMSVTFNLLRANELIWAFVVNNYLLGQQPLPFDLLFWNADATRIPAAMHSYYLRNMYQQNLLSQPGALRLNGHPLDLAQVRLPLYVQAAREDHIAPYRSVFRGAQCFSGPVRFVLAGSGHIAGVINAPAAHRYDYTTRDDSDLSDSIETWLAGAARHEGSWWPDWDRWLSALSGPRVPARLPGSDRLPPIEDAPGAYVETRS